MKQPFLLVCVLLLFSVSFSAAQEDGAPEGTVSENPGDAELIKGIDLFTNGETEQAYQVFGDACRANPDLAPAGVLAALLASQQGDVQQVYQYLDRAVIESPSDPEAWFRLARLAADSQRYSELELLLAKGGELLVRFEESHKDSSRVSFLKGESIALAARLAQGRGDLPGAESKLREYVALFPDVSDGYVSLGYLLLEQGKKEEAVAEFDRARELNPASHAGWLTAASLLNGKGETDTAIQMAEEHRNDPNLSASDLSRMTLLYYRRGRLDDAKETASRIPDGLERYKWDGLLAYAAGDNEGAEKAYNKALLIASDDFEVLNGLILAIADQGDETRLSDALNRADRLRRQYPQSDEAAGTYAWVEFRLGNVERAEDILLPILDRGGLTPTNAFYLACAAFYRKDRDLVVQLLSSALKSKDFFPKRGNAEKLLDSILKAE